MVHVTENCRNLLRCFSFSTLKARTKCLTKYTLEMVTVANEIAIHSVGSALATPNIDHAVTCREVTPSGSLHY